MLPYREKKQRGNGGFPFVVCKRHSFVLWDKSRTMANLSWLLMWLDIISGLRINLNKSEIILIGSIAEVESLAFELGCKVRALPSFYLGLPLGGPHNSVVVWDGIEERFRKRLALWKRQYISKDGRITLIRSTLSSLHSRRFSLGKRQFGEKTSSSEVTNNLFRYKNWRLRC